MSDPSQAADRGEHQVSPLELFFDLVFVFAITQVTKLLTNTPTWDGILRGALVLAAVWWAWIGYTWLTSATEVDEGGVRLAMLAATTAMLGVALAAPAAFGADAVFFGTAYLVVSIIHLVLSTAVGRDPDRRSALVRFAPTSLIAAILVFLAGFLGGDVQLAVWVMALAIGYGGPTVIGLGRGWHVAPAHFAERYGLVILIALGESIIAIGAGAGLDLTPGVVVGATLGAVVVSALWWLYFDVAAIFARRRLMEATGVARARLARDAYTYLHLPMVAGIVLFAFGLKTTLHHVHAHLQTVPAVALCGGVALYLLAHIGFLYRATGYIFRRRTIGAAVLLAWIPVASAISAIAALGFVSIVSALVVAYEAIRHRGSRSEVRRSERTS